MLPDRVSNPGPLTYESGALPIALRGPAGRMDRQTEANLLPVGHNKKNFLSNLRFIGTLLNFN